MCASNGPLRILHSPRTRFVSKVVDGVKKGGLVMFWRSELRRRALDEIWVSFVRIACQGDRIWPPYARSHPLSES